MTAVDPQPAGSRFPDVTRCARGCGATVAYPYPSGETTRRTAARAGLDVVIPDRDVARDDMEFTARLIQLGWGPTNGGWVCPNHPGGNR